MGEPVPHAGSGDTHWNPRLPSLGAEHELVVVAAGRGGLADLFPVVPERSPLDAPARILCAASHQALADRIASNYGHPHRAWDDICTPERTRALLRRYAPDAAPTPDSAPAGRPPAPRPAEAPALVGLGADTA